MTVSFLTAGATTECYCSLAAFSLCIFSIKKSKMSTEIVDRTRKLKQLLLYFRS